MFDQGTVRVNLRKHGQQFVYMGWRTVHSSLGAFVSASEFNCGSQSPVVFGSRASVYSVRYVH